MICVECLTPVGSLYTRYANNHLQLTDCPKCKKPVDPYIEIDNVLLFIDVLLLKHGAYRHLVFNSLEERASNKCKDSMPTPTGLRSQVCNVKNWLIKYDKINRVWALLLTFEIYLTWATEERKYRMRFTSRDDVLGFPNAIASSHGLIIDKLILWTPMHQYLYFALYCLIDITLLHSFTQYYVIDCIGWGRNVPDPKSALSYTVLLSYGAKIFPILMLIWPYDNIISMSIIKWAANLYLIESLKIVTNLSYNTVITTFTLVSILRFMLVKPLMILLISKFNLAEMQNIFNAEYGLLANRLIIAVNNILL